MPASWFWKSLRLLMVGNFCSTSYRRSWLRSVWPPSQAWTATPFGFVPISCRASTDCSPSQQQLTEVKRRLDFVKTKKVRTIDLKDLAKSRIDSKRVTALESRRRAGRGYGST